MIELLIINSLLIWGIYASLQEGFIFEKLGYWIREGIIIRGRKNIAPESEWGRVKVYPLNLPSWIQKPLATCPICMASVYGTPVFWLSYFTEFLNVDFIIIVYICYVFALAGLNYLILTFMPE